jgi:hypothetical protein
MRYMVATCGKAGLRSVVFDGRGKGLAIHPLVPGSTLTDPDLQHDVIKSFTMATQRAVPACKQAVVIHDTTLVHAPEKPKGGPWQEAWVGRACGHDVGELVDFLPNAQGTAFKMGLPGKSSAAVQ